MSAVAVTDWREELASLRPYLVQITAKNLGPLREDAEDVVGMAMERCLRIGYDPSRGATVTTWAVMVARFAVREHLRSKSPTSRHGVERIQETSLDGMVLEDGKQIELPDPTDCFAGLLDDLEAEPLKALCARLPEREAFAVQARCEGVMFNTIAESLNISESRAYQLYNHGIERLRRLLEGEDQGTEEPEEPHGDRRGKWRFPKGWIGASVVQRLARHRANGDDRAAMLAACRNDPAFLEAAEREFGELIEKAAAVETEGGRTVLVAEWFRENRDRLVSEGRGVYLNGPTRGRLPKNRAAVELGRAGGMKGGTARAAGMTPEERSESARLAAEGRWGSKAATERKPGKAVAGIERLIAVENENLQGLRRQIAEAKCRITAFQECLAVIAEASA